VGLQEGECYPFPCLSGKSALNCDFRVLAAHTRRRISTITTPTKKATKITVSNRSADLKSLAFMSFFVSAVVRAFLVGPAEAFQVVGLVEGPENSSVAVLVVIAPAFGGFRGFHALGGLLKL
jgi:hypothetical protein